MTYSFWVFAPDHTYAYAPLTSFPEMRAALVDQLLKSEPFGTNSWQQLDVAGSTLHHTYELQDVTLVITDTDAPLEPLQLITLADLPWAEDHFLERVGGEPVNPGNTHHYWPYHGKATGDELHRKGEIYDHNYMERYWPKHANDPRRWEKEARQGIRFEYGDLNDVISLLVTDPLTRQAYLPVWHPEDTGATDKQRVPCTLGYHFIIREGRLNCRYYLRSCEAYRHFHNDVYLTIRLMHWVAQQFNLSTQLINHHTDDNIVPGDLTLHISSFHGFVGDLEHLERIAGLIS